jgi:uncharacterized protein (TIGR03437 family)
VLGPPGSGLPQAQKGTTIILWSTGGGLTTPVVANNALAPATGAVMQATPSVRIGGTAAVISYAGLAPGFFGLYQINVALPQNLPSGKASLTLSSGTGDVSYDLWIQ